MWDGIEQLKSQHEALDFQSAIDVQEEEIEHLTIGDTSPEIHQLDPEVITALRHDVEDQRRVIEDKEIARRMQGFDHFVLQSYADEEFAIETQEDFERLRLQEQSDREYAMTLSNSGNRTAHRYQPRNNDDVDTVQKSLMALSIDSCVQNKINVAEALQQGTISLPWRQQYKEEEKNAATASELVNKNSKKLEGKAMSTTEIVDRKAMSTTEIVDGDDGLLTAVKLPPISCISCRDSNIPGYELPCSHAQCISCMTRLLRVALNDSSLLPLMYCGLPIDIHVAKALLSGEACQKLFSRQAEIEAKNKMYCPQCASFINLDYVDNSESSVLNCGCGVVLCTLCRSLQHQGVSCQDNNSRSDLSQDTLVLSLAKENKWQQCPGCSIVIELVSGCNHITCNNCRTDFCYQCASLWDTENTRCSSGQCELWEEENLVERAEERVRVEQARGRVFRQGIEIQQAQEEATIALTANETCTHDWVRDDRIPDTQCESCGYDLNMYGMVCHNECSSIVCYTCAYHRIGDYGWR